MRGRRAAEEEQQMNWHRRVMVERRVRGISKRRKIGKAVAAHIEQLESRCLLTTLTGWGETTYTDPLTNITTVTPQTRSTLYRNSTDDIMQVTLGGSVTAEFVGAWVDDTTGLVTLRDLVGLNELDPANPAQKLKGADIFAIYVQKADINSFIAITKVTVDQSGKMNLEPFKESSGQIRVSSAKDGSSITVDTAANSGKLFLGARTKALQNQQNSDNIPILQATLTSRIGILPQNTGQRLDAGLVVADGQDLGKFLFGGTVTGKVSIGGSMNVFACGELLTGDATGTFASSLPSTSPDNFHVKGDLRDLVVAGCIGTGTGADLDNPAYLTRFELKVDGRLGQVRTYDSFTGRVTVLGDQGVSTDTLVENEIETRGLEPGTSTAGALLTVPSFDNGDLTDATFNNDTPDTAQYLGTFTSAELGKNDAIQVRGVLAASNKIQDFADYYAVALMAGQTIEVQLIDLDLAGLAGTTPTMPYISLGVFDPDGRLIATNYSNVDLAMTMNMPFRFTTDRPGIYRFAIGIEGETVWGTAPGPRVSGSQRPIEPYELRISNAGAITLGAVAAINNIFDESYGQVGFTLQSGDLGALVATGAYMEDYKTSPMLMTAATPTGVDVANGNLRTIQGASIGIIINGLLGDGVSVNVPNGSVGLLKSTAGILLANDSYTPTDYLPPLEPPVTPPPPPPIVGFDYQMVDAATTFGGNIICNRRIGVIRAGDTNTNFPDTFMANADLTGDDGIIDLIDVAGDLGSVSAGGPHIYTGPKGNLRYLDVGGTVWRDSLFGGGPAPATAYDPGESVTLNDDSGASITVSPADANGVLTITSYGIRGSGGVAVVRVDANSGVTVTGNLDSPMAGAEIGAINIAAGTPGPGIVQGPGGQLILDPNAPPLSVTLNGKGRVDVLNVTGPSFTSIVNNSLGEIVNIQATSIGTLSAASIGTPIHNTAATIQPQAVLIGATFPFDQARVAVIAGDILTVNSRGAVANIAVGLGGGGGNLQTLTADSDNTRSATTFEGIVGPVYATGNIGTVNIGAGISYVGSGNGSLAGVYCEGPINLVQGAKGADIRGGIASGSRIGSIRLTNASLINADVMVITPLSDSRRLPTVRAFPGGGGTSRQPVYQIGSISTEGSGTTATSSGTTTTTATGKKARRIRKDLRGKTGGGTTPKPTPPAYLPGGIIGTFIGGYNIQTIKESGGFGILNTTVWTSPAGTLDRVQADGYGIRGCELDGGIRINNIVALGDGSLLPVTNFSASVRTSEIAGGDPNAPVAANRTTDLYEFLEIPTSKPSVVGVTDSGVISDLAADALRDLGLLQAFRFEGGTPVASTTGKLTTPFSTLNFANSIKAIKITQDMSDVQIVTGALPTFSVGRDVLNLDMTVAGPIKTLTVGRDFNNKSRIRAIGPDGSIGTITIGRNMAGTISAERKIGKIYVKGRLTGKILENGKRRTK